MWFTEFSPVLHNALYEIIQVCLDHNFINLTQKDNRGESRKQLFQNTLFGLDGVLHCQLHLGKVMSARSFQIKNSQLTSSHPKHLPQD